MWSSNSFAAACSGGSADAGKYPNQYEVSEYESAAGCSMSFSENPNIASINATIIGNGALGSVNDRLPSEPLVVVPYDSVGSYVEPSECFQMQRKQEHLICYLHVT